MKLIIVRTTKLVTALSAFAALASASTIFGLGGDPNQSYTFTRSDTPVANSEYPNATVTVPAGPYAGWLGQNIPGDYSYFFCITFLKTSNFGGSYPGTLTSPSTQAELEAAYLGAELLSMGAQNASLAAKGAISMAIWQITDSTPGDVPRDPAAQSYVDSAVTAYAGGGLSSAGFANSVIFVPTDPSIQSFMMATPGSAVPEPDTIVLILAGAALIALSRMRWKKRKSKINREDPSVNDVNRIHSLNPGGLPIVCPLHIAGSVSN